MLVFQKNLMETISNILYVFLQGIYIYRKYQVLLDKT